MFVCLLWEWLWLNFPEEDRILLGARAILAFGWLHRHACVIQYLMQPQSAWLLSSYCTELSGKAFHSVMRHSALSQFHPPLFFGLKRVFTKHFATLTSDKHGSKSSLLTQARSHRNRDTKLKEESAQCSRKGYPGAQIFCRFQRAWRPPSSVDGGHFKPAGLFRELTAVWTEHSGENELCQGDDQEPGGHSVRASEVLYGERRTFKKDTHLCSTHQPSLYGSMAVEWLSPSTLMEFERCCKGEMDKNVQREVCPAYGITFEKTWGWNYSHQCINKWLIKGCQCLSTWNV